MINELKKTTEASMQKSVDIFIDELKKIRTGRANVSMLDNIMVNYYGNPSPLNQVASVSTPDAKSFIISPWETSLLKEIENSIIKANLGMTPQNDGKIIRLKVPELTEERRKDLVKNVKKIAEDARISVRKARKDSNDSLKKALKDKLMSEDEQKKASDEIQKITDNYIKKIDDISSQKESDLLKV